MKYRLRGFDVEWHNKEFTNYANFARVLKRLLMTGFEVVTGRS